jgi:nucleoside-diphosphate-sugar epimerase
VRSADIPVVVGDASLARKLLGWKPQVPMAETLRAVLNQYRALGAKGLT